MGAGHTGAARELARRLEARGHRAAVVDLLDAIPRPLAAAWLHTYRLQLRHAPTSYERAYRLYYRPSRTWPHVIAATARLARRRLDDWIERQRPDVVVSTYAFATLVLGHLRREARLGVPVVNYLTDLGIHPRTVHPGADLHLALHPDAAAEVRALVAAPVEVTGPAVAPAFAPLAAPARRAGRVALGLDPDAVVVVVSAGSWGVGDALVRTVGALDRTPGVQVVTLCGREDRLRERLAAMGAGRAVGWTDRVPEYLAVADVVVENAGGLTSLEALASGAALVSYRPIPGHGRDNVRALVQAGLSVEPADDAELLAAVRRLADGGPERERQRDATRALFAREPAAAIEAFVSANRAR